MTWLGGFGAGFTALCCFTGILPFLLGAVLRPKPGDCCVYCSYADVACPPVQQGDRCCG
nr:GDCCVxC domain-containing (seleno)protein [Roseovarius lutimaris]